MAVQEDQESVKAVLDTMASITLIPRGFQQYKGRIADLCERALSMYRSNQRSASEIAERLVSLQLALMALTSAALFQGHIFIELCHRHTSLCQPTLVACSNPLQNLHATQHAFD